MEEHSTVLKALTDALLRGERVSIPGLGVLMTVHRTASEMRMPNGDLRLLPPRTELVFEREKKA